MARTSVSVPPTKLGASWRPTESECTMTYREEFAEAISDPDAYWARQSERVHWFRKPQQVLDASRPPFYRWYPDGVLNTCFNALDRHVINGRGEQPALIFHS